MIEPITEKTKEKWQVRFMHLLKNHRAKKNMSQAQLAKILGVTSGLIGQYEAPSVTKNNKLVSCLCFLHKFSSLVGVPMKDFIGLLDEGIELPNLAPWEESILTI